MKIYLVGGAVRDKLLNKEPKDLDYVVVGSTVQEMKDLGFKQVGSSFPVFLHPETGDEYALARREELETEGKYTSFSVFTKDVTIEEDLGRRDLTINSMAWDTDSEVLIDPFNGAIDLKNKVLRATSSAFEEDPIRVLRVARFLSALGWGWVMDQNLFYACRSLWSSHQHSATKERVFKELDKALKTDNPDRFFNAMQSFSDKWFKEYYEGRGVPQPPQHHPEGCVFTHQQLCLVQGAREALTPEQLFSIMCHDLGKAHQYKTYGNLHGHEDAGVSLVVGLCERLGVPNSYRELAVKVCKYHTKCHKAFDMNPNKVMKLFEDLGLGCVQGKFKLKAFTDCCRIDARGRLGKCSVSYPQEDYLMACLQAVIDTDTKAISKSMLQDGKLGASIGEAIRVARIDSIRRVKNQLGGLDRVSGYGMGVKVSKVSDLMEEHLHAE